MLSIFSLLWKIIDGFIRWRRNDKQRTKHRLVNKLLCTVKVNSITLYRRSSAGEKSRETFGCFLVNLTLTLCRLRGKQGKCNDVEYEVAQPLKTIHSTRILDYYWRLTPTNQFFDNNKKPHLQEQRLHSTYQKSWSRHLTMASSVIKERLASLDRTNVGCRCYSYFPSTVYWQFIKLVGPVSGITGTYFAPSDSRPHRYNAAIHDLIARIIMAAIIRYSHRDMTNRHGATPMQKERMLWSPNSYMQYVLSTNHPHGR